MHAISNLERYSIPADTSGDRPEMVLAYHAIFSAYGFWLPNDPRGSWSDWVRRWDLVLESGPVTKIEARRSVANDPHDWKMRMDAKRVLMYPPVEFNGVQARAIARGFAEQVVKSGYQIHACSVLPNHIHLVIGRHRYQVEQIVNLLKGSATRKLIEEGIHPFQTVTDGQGRRPSAWGSGLWKVFLNHPATVDRAIRYVEENPCKEGKRRQKWWFTIPFVSSR